MPQDPSRAAELWKSAAAAGLPECLFVLGNRLCRPDSGVRGGGGTTVASSAGGAGASASSNGGASSLPSPLLPGASLEGLSKAQKKRAKEKAKKVAAANAAANGGTSGSSNSSDKSTAAAQAKATREAVALFACAASAGLAPAQFNVANCLEHGLGRHRAAAEAW